MTGRVLVVGSYNQDLVAFGAIPRVGETLRADRFESLPGGKGSNQAIAAARLGAQVNLCARVGADAHGEEAMRLWASEGVGNHGIVDEAAHTGVAIVLVGATGDNAIAIAPGANARLESDDITRRESLFADADVVLLQLETPLPCVATALELSRRHGCISILDPAPAAPLSDELLTLVDLLTPNESEASALVDGEVCNVESALAAGHNLRDRGCARALVTLGEKGSVFVTPDACWHLPAASVSVRDTTGAGDAFNGGLAAALAGGSDWLSAARFATRVAAASVRHEGVLQGLPRPTDLRAIPDTVESPLSPQL